MRNISFSFFNACIMLLGNGISMRFTLRTREKGFDSKCQRYTNASTSVHLWCFSTTECVGALFCPPRCTFPRAITDLHAYTPQICVDRLRAKSLINGERQSKIEISCCDKKIRNYRARRRNAVLIVDDLTMLIIS